MFIYQGQFRSNEEKQEDQVVPIFYGKCGETSAFKILVFNSFGTSDTVKKGATYPVERLLQQQNDRKTRKKVTRKRKLTGEQEDTKPCGYTTSNAI